MFCIKCGAIIADNSKFCEQCGAPQTVVEVKNEIPAVEEIKQEEVVNNLVSEAEEILAEAEKAEVAPVLELPEDVVEEIKEAAAEAAAISETPLVNEPVPEAPKADFEMGTSYTPNANASQTTYQSSYNNPNQQNSGYTPNYNVPVKKKGGAGKVIAIVLIVVALLGAVVAGLSLFGGKSYKSSDDVMDAYFKCLEKGDMQGIIDIMEPTYTELMLSFCNNDVETFLSEYDYAFYAGYDGRKIDDIEYEYIMSATEDELDEMMGYLDPEEEWQAADNYYAYIEFEDGTEEYFDIITVKAGNKYMILQVN